MSVSRLGEIFGRKIAGTMDGVIERLLEGLAAGGLEGLAAAGFYRCFYGAGRGAALAGAGIGIFALAVFLRPDLTPGLLALSAVWMMLAGGICQTRQWRELFLAGGTWLTVRSLACLWPDSVPLQTVSALALFGMAALYLLGRGKLYPLWGVTLVCLWLLGGFFGGMVYGEVWQERAMKAACYLALGGIFVFQQIFCIRQETNRRIWEEDRGCGEPEEWSGAPGSGQRNGAAAGEAGKGIFDAGLKDWRKAASQELGRLRIFEHDFRHHLDMLGALYEQGDPAEARAYLEDLKQERWSGRGWKAGGERELSYLMMAKKEACRKAGIHFSSQILGSPRGIARMDMTALVLNLMDNAIRACEEAPQPRSIGIMLLARGDLWQIELVNTGKYVPPEAERGWTRRERAERERLESESAGRKRTERERPESESAGRKRTGQERPESESAGQERTGREPAEREETEAAAGGRLHGIGLISVRQIVEKYQGVFEIRQEGDMVVQKLILTGQLPE